MKLEVCRHDCQRHHRVELTQVLAALTCKAGPCTTPVTESVSCGTANHGCCAAHALEA